MSKGKPPFAPIPLRALSDDRLTLTHLRALGAIGHHDRMSLVTGKGQGCWASTKTMAEEIGANVSNMSAAVNQLARWGYIEIGTLQIDKRKRVYRVIFEPVESEDHLLTDKRSPADHLPTGKEAAENHLSIDEQTGEIVCPTRDNVVEFQSGAEGNIFRKAGERNSVETGKEIQQKLARQSSRCDADSAFAPKSVSDVQGVLGALANLLSERPEQLQPTDIESWHDWLNVACDLPDLDTDTRQRITFAGYDLDALSEAREAKAITLNRKRT